MPRAPKATPGPVESTVSDRAEIDSDTADIDVEAGVSAGAGAAAPRSGVV